MLNPPSIRQHFNLSSLRLAGLCCKNSRRTFMGVQSHLLFSLGRHAKQAGDEGHLPSDISFVHPVHLSLANHMHRFIALKCSPCRFHGKEAHPRLDESFEKAVVLLDRLFKSLTCLSSTDSGRIPAT